MAADSLTSLPSEVLIKILELVPVRRICELRCMGVAVRDFIDANEDAIARHTIESNRARLITRMSGLTDLEGLDFIDIMHRYTSYYGDLQPRLIEDDPPILRILFALFFQHRPENFSVTETHEMGLHMIEFSQCFSICHTWVHAETPYEQSHYSYKYVQGAWTHAERTAAHLPAPISNVEYLRARLQDKQLLQGPHYADRHGAPQFPITLRHGLDYYDCCRFLKICEEDLLGKALRLPALVAGFGYCVKSKRMQDLVHDCCTDEEPEDTDVFQSRLLQAALLEQVFIF